MSDPNETRVWPSGERTTRAEADAKGLRWATVCLYTEPEPTDSEVE